MFRFHLSQNRPKGTGGPGEDDKSPLAPGKEGPCDWEVDMVHPPEAGLPLLSIVWMATEEPEPELEKLNQGTYSRTLGHR